MEEKRSYFRVKNPGTIKAKYQAKELYVIDISPSGANLDSKGITIMKDGVIELFINHFSIRINYAFLKKEGENTIVIFKMDDKANQLLRALKHVRSSMESQVKQSIEITPLDQLVTRAPYEPYGDEPGLNNYTRLNSLYSIRLYQLLRQLIKSGGGEIALDYLRKVLGVDQLKSYSSYNLLKKNILEPSKKEINEQTDMTVSYAEVRKDDKVTGVQFKILSLLH